MDNYIPYGKQSITQQDINSVIEVLKSDWLTQGPIVSKFEQAIAAYCGVKYAVAVSSATAALHIACIAADLQHGDRLWTSPNTFVASANCGRYCGATIDFVDIDPRTYNLSIKSLKEKLEQAEKSGQLPKILIPVHFAGQSCEMEEIGKLSQKYGFQIIEDASHAIGGEYKDQSIGNCSFSEMVVFSFHPVKIITTGEGGIVVTNRWDLYEKLKRLRSHGVTKDPDLFQNKSHGPWYYQQLELGYNYRITDIQSALGLSQLQRLDNFVKQRRWLANRYNHLLKKLPLTRPWQNKATNSSWHLYVVRLQLKKITKTYQQIFEALRQTNIGVQKHYIPVHTQPYYQHLGFRWGQFPEAEKYYQEAISLPLYYGLTETAQDKVIHTLSRILE
ncbi:UDP-4-amino-4,6-dideoxy-N-acetyl-beta-L-altrosamine transaminase [Leptothoe kymatousa]|uniref:UDP-4-amino-4, 6-dideoxy-N-acetyl-beta-L-altrosamine transaminase n=1 Tax=Leptothoe kymatousa TAU-MAC 1615 TaxID=2364775 RepID=A0ABS5Y0K0_9CYAN|nr:UDP-4-amino-4,6-dideoxy-N-acetyl-beta-L-altrosamine transaminase [Leptothoe kymatousa]MBT9311372.1 UDP-4-amino-4,6-dideoxy-N-acetyl-beta-L-altrosamine transaminase [Leptothoe kymatousa TAU-MAC 1615]